MSYSPSKPNHQPADVSRWIRTRSLKFIFILLCTLSLITLALVKYQKARRVDLFCTLIKPTTSLSEALQIIDQHGKFTQAQFDRGNTTVVVMVPEDFLTAMIYGPRKVELSFKNGFYRVAIEKYHLEDDIRPVCK